MRLRPYVVVGALAVAAAVATNGLDLSSSSTVASEPTATSEESTEPTVEPAVEPTAEPSVEPSAVEDRPTPTSDEPTAAPEPSTAQPQQERHVDCDVQKCIALTFDDGPGPQTMEVADAFTARGQRATFFVVGNRVGDWSDQMVGAAAQGHEIGLHTWDHSDLPPLGKNGIREQLSDTLEAVREAGVEGVDLFRPPFGDTNATVRDVAASLGLSEAMWSIDSLDWRDRDTNILIDKILDEAKPGAIVLMHDIHPSTVAAVPKILDGLMDRGYEMVTVDELVGQVKPGQSYSAR